MKIKHIKPLPIIGERLVVHGMSQNNSLVESVEWDSERHDWRINLDWGSHGKSRVWAHDEHNVWFRWKSNS
jgi:hypothetical protein